jgi:hypothetical protein
MRANDMLCRCGPGRAQRRTRLVPAGGGQRCSPPGLRFLQDDSVGLQIAGTAAGGHQHHVVRVAEDPPAVALGAARCVPSGRTGERRRP